MEQSLPQSAYTTAEAFAAERERRVLPAVVRGGSRGAGRGEPGAYLVADVAGEQVLIVRTPTATWPATTTCAVTGALAS